MIIDIQELENQEKQSMVLEFNEIIEDLNSEIPVKGVLEVVSKGIYITVSGKVQTELKVECDRCLKEFLHHVAIDIDEKFVKGKIIEDNIKEYEIKNENFFEELGEVEQIDLTDLIYQNIILNIPIQKLCDLNCKGSEDASIKEKVQDPRMDVFKDILDKMK